MVGGVCVLLLALAPEPAHALTLPTREHAPTTAPTKGVPSPRVTLPRTAIKPATADQRGLAESLGLEPRVDGGYDYVGRKDERFDATIRPDGVVEFRLDSTVEVTLDGVCAAAICAHRKPKARREQRRKQAAVAAVKVATLLAEAAFGRFTHGAHTYGYPVNVPANYNYRPFDLMPFNYAAAQGRFGHTPTPAASMQDFMDRTYELRVELALSAGLDDLEAARRRLPSTLLAIWRDDARTLAERRAAILEVWDEIDNLGAHSDPKVAGDQRFDERRRDSIAAAREAILDFVRRHAREGTPAAFTDAELQAANAREGAVVFDPYD